jgi:hypothetical protein
MHADCIAYKLQFIKAIEKAFKGYHSLCRKAQDQP